MFTGVLEKKKNKLFIFRTRMRRWCYNFTVKRRERGEREHLKQFLRGTEKMRWSRRYMGQTHIEYGSQKLLVDCF